MYYQGYGVTQDYVRAHMWVNLAAAQEPEKVEPEVDGLEKKLEEVFLLLISRVEKHFEDKEALATKLAPRLIVERV